ncbi:MAG: glycosyltransferase family 2 protein [Bacteroidia bacterium]
MKPEISICIPAYKQAEKLQKLLESIQVQTFQPKEIIISDDSDDNSVEELLKKFELPIKYFRNSPALGSPGNWNFAVTQAGCEWVKLMHHDDYFTHDRALQMFVNELEINPGGDYYFCGTTIQQAGDGSSHVYKVDTRLINKLDKIPAFLLHKNLIGAPSTGFFRREIKINYNRKLIWLVDIEFYLRLLHNYKVRYLPDPAITTVMFEGQLTTRLKDNKEVELSEFIYCYLKHSGTMNSLNLRIARSRMLDLFRIFNVKSAAELRFDLNNKRVPEFAKWFLRVAGINRRMAFSIFYRMNAFKI